MDTSEMPLSQVYDGWDGYNTSLIHAIAPRTPEELAWRPGENLRSVGELAAHIGLGRVDWFHRMGAPLSEDLHQQAVPYIGTGDVETESYQALVGNAAGLVHWLEISWHMVDTTLRQWSVADLPVTYRLPYLGKFYAVSRQWTLWRMLSHDIQHGGQLSLMLGQQGIDAPELIYLGGHLTEPPVIEEG